MLIELQIKDHDVTIGIDNRVVESSVENLNMVVRVLEAQKEHLTATQFFDAAAKDVDFRNPSEDRIVAFLRKVVDERICEPEAGIENVFPEYAALHDRGLVSRCIFIAGAPAYLYPTATGVSFLASLDGQDPEKAVQDFMANHEWAHPSWWNKT
jgi:hypothetical protein